MSIQRITLHRYRLPLAAPLDLGPTTITHRDGALVQMEDKAGHTGWGDVAPLPGFSHESLDEACRQIESFATALVDGALPDQWGRAVERWPNLAAHPTAASARFGMEQAMAALIARRRGAPLAEMWVDAPRSAVSLNALLMGQPDGVRTDARRVQAQGYRAAKLKVGRREVGAEIKLVRTLHEMWNGGVALRLDANRAWTYDEARAFAEGIANVPIEYIEEPLADPARLPELAAATELPIALDESMQDGTVQSLVDHAYARAMVLKPTLTGGLWAAWERAMEAERLGMTPVLSAAYESGVGMQALVALAASVGTADVPVGFDTYRRLAEDVLTPRLNIEGPTVDVGDVLHVRHGIRMEMLHQDASIPA